MLAARPFKNLTHPFPKAPTERFFQLKKKNAFSGISVDVALMQPSDQYWTTVFDVLQEEKWCFFSEGFSFPYGSRVFGSAPGRIGLDRRPARQQQRQQLMAQTPWTSWTFWTRDLLPAGHVQSKQSVATLCGISSRRLCEISAEDLDNVPSVVPGH